MPLTTATLNNQLSFTLTRTNTGFNATKANNNSVTFNLNGLNVTTFNQVFAQQYTLAAAANQDIDLTSLTNLVYESFSFGHALLLMVTATGSQCTVTPGPTNGLQWFFGGSTQSVIIPAGGFFCFSEPVTGPGHVVDSTHKVLRFTNSGGTSLTLNVAILGSTT